MNTEMLRKEQAPFYVYEKSVIKSQIELVKDTLPQFDCLYSIKCNPYQPVVDFIAANGIGSDAASWREVEISAEAGMKAEDIYFSTPGKTREDIAKSIGTCVLIADSFHELELLDELAKEKGLQVKAGLRINPDFTMAGGAGVSTKFGVDEEVLLASKDYLQSLKNVALVGIHIHAKSQELDADRLAAYYKNVFELALRCQDTLSITLEFVNFGGGLGVAYHEGEQPLDCKKLKTSCAALTAHYKDKLSARLLVESGRFLVCHSGTYVTEIVDIKTSRGIKYLVAKNTLNGFGKASIREMVCSYVPDGEPNPSEPLFTSKNAFTITLATDETQLEKVHIVGHLCTAVDVMAHDILLPKAKIGDRLLISNAGSYAYSLTPMLFASQPVPTQFLVD